MFISIFYFLLFFSALCLIVKFTVGRSSKKGLLTGVGIYLLGCLVGSTIDSSHDLFYTPSLASNISWICQGLGIFLIGISLIAVLIDLLIILTKKKKK